MYKTTIFAAGCLKFTDAMSISTGLGVKVEDLQLSQKKSQMDLLLAQVGISYDVIQLSDDWQLVPNMDLVGECDENFDETWKYDPNTGIKYLQQLVEDQDYHGFSLDLRFDNSATTEGNIQFKRCATGLIALEQL